MAGDQGAGGGLSGALPPPRMRVSLIAALDQKSIQFEGSDSLDNPASVARLAGDAFSLPSRRT